MSKGVGLGGISRAGGVITSLQNAFTVDGSPVVVLGSPVASHGDSPHRSASIINGSAWMTWDGIPVSTGENNASCGHGITLESPWFQVDQ